MDLVEPLSLPATLRVPTQQQEIFGLVSSGVSVLVPKTNVHIALMACCLILLASSPASPAQTNTTAGISAKASTAGILFRKKQYAKAAQLYSEIISVDPRNLAAYYYRGLCYQQMGMRDQAYSDLKIYSQLRAAQPSRTSAGQLNSLYMPQVVDLLKRYTDTKSGTDALAKGIANLQKTQAQGHGAFLGMQAIKPQDLRNYSQAGRLVDRITLLKSTGKPEQALQLCPRLISLLPAYSYPHQLSGCCYFDTGNFKAAVEELSAACKLNPQDPYNFLSRAVACTYAKDYTMAVNDYSRALALDGYRDVVHDEGMRMIVGAFMVPGKSEIYLRKATLENKLKQYDPAVADCSEAIKLSSNYDAAYFARAEAYIAEKKFDTALGDYDAVIKINPKDDQAFMLEGDLYQKMNEDDKAIESYSHVIALDAKEAWRAYDARARLYDKEGKSDLAAQDRATIVKLGFKPSKSSPQPAK